MTVKIDGTNTEANPAFTGADTDTGLQCGTNELKLVTGGSTRATVDSSGKLGVATTSPQSKLSVGNAASTDDGLSITFTGDNSTVAKYFANTSTGEVTIGGVATNYFPTFHSSGSEAMRLDASGRLLVGTDSSKESLSNIQCVRADNSTLSIFTSDISASGQAKINLGPSNNITGAQIICDAEEDFSTGANRTGRLSFTTRLDGTLIERLRIGSDGKFITNTVQQHFTRGATTGNSSFTRDFVIGATQSAIISAAFNHFGLFSHGCSRLSFAATGGSFSTSDIHTQRTGNGGSWSISKPNNTTLRVTKNAGSHTGSGHWFIHVIAS